MTPETRARIEALFERYPEKRGALLPAIYLVQAEKGWVDAAATRELAELFELEPVQVHEVLSFYNMFYTEPQGRHHVYVCTNVPCSLRGARSLLRGLEAYLGVHAGETTRDGRITLGHEECLGSCGTAPVLRVDGAYHENVDFADARRIVDGLE
ncbi:MAG TPA: NADH-quinone oxidoreductase subunit NuoE [Myxococcota bacterium]|nr:NADH-quinone oxidoreductase subunit NuoE [Myxococcota bacterium]